MRRLQIYGGMGLMDDLPIERFWRDARVERIWDGTSEIQRHIIGRELAATFGGLKFRCLRREYFRQEERQRSCVI